MCIWPFFLLRSNIHFWNQYEKTVFRNPIRYSWRKNVSSLRRDNNYFLRTWRSKMKETMQNLWQRFFKTSLWFLMFLQNFVPDIEITKLCQNHRSPVRVSSDCYWKTNFFVNNKCIFLLKRRGEFTWKFIFYMYSTMIDVNWTGQNMEY